VIRRAKTTTSRWPSLGRSRMKLARGSIHVAGNRDGNVRRASSARAPAKYFLQFRPQQHNRKNELHQRKSLPSLCALNPLLVSSPILSNLIPSSSSRASVTSAQTGGTIFLFAYHRARANVTHYARFPARIVIASGDRAHPTGHVSSSNHVCPPQGSPA